MREGGFSSSRSLPPTKSLLFPLLVNLPHPSINFSWGFRRAGGKRQIGEFWRHKRSSSAMMILRAIHGDGRKKNVSEVRANDQNTLISLPPLILAHKYYGPLPFPSQFPTPNGFFQFQSFKIYMPNIIRNGSN
jgi:hypothetical protein